MGLLNLLKSAIDILAGNENYLSVASDTGGNDEVSGFDTSKFEKEITKFYSRLSEEELDDKDTDEFTDNLLDEMIAGRVKNSSQSISEAYRKWKLSKGDREQKKREEISKKQKEAKTIIDMLRHYDELSEEERSALTDSDSRFYLGKLEDVAEYEDVAEIVYSWFEKQTMDENKYELTRYFPDDYVVSKGIEEINDNTPVTETEYLFRKFVFSRICSNCNPDYHHMPYEDYAEYFKRYWLKSGNHPRQIDCDDLIVNRPCYFKNKLQYVTPHFHMGKRCIEEDCYQKAQVYLFSDTIEIIKDLGRLEIRLSDIIHIDCNYEKYLLEITCNNNHMYLLEYTEMDNLLELQALIIYFIKNPQ